MKKLLIFCGVVLFLLLVLVVAVSVYVETFDVDRYRPQITKKIESWVGNPVSIGSLDLGWNGGLALVVGDFAVLEDGRGPDESAFAFKRFDLTLKLWPLFSRRIETGAVRLVDPRIHVIREPDGQIRVRGVRFSGKSRPSGGVPPKETQGSEKPPAAAAAAFVIDRILVQNGTLRFEDRGRDFPMDLHFKDANILLENVAVDRAIRFEVAFSAFGGRRNVVSRGFLDGLAWNQPQIRSFEAALLLEGVDAAELGRQIPAVGELGIENSLGGVLKFKIDDALAREGKLVKFQAGAEIHNGRVKLKSVKDPVRNVRLKVWAGDNAVQVTEFSAEFFGGSTELTGRIDGYPDHPENEVKADIKNIGLRETLAAVGKDTRLDGKLSFFFEGTGSGLKNQQIAQTLSGSGEFTLREGVILRGNPLRDVLNKLSALPGFEEAVQKHVPEYLKAKINAPVTPILKPIRHFFTVEDGRLYLEGLLIPTELFTIDADVYVLFSGAVLGRGNFIIGRQITDALARGSENFSYLADRDGTISVPIRFEASRRGFVILPDLSRFGAQTAVAKGREFLQQLVGRALDKERYVPEAATAAEVPAATAPAAQKEVIIPVEMPEEAGAGVPAAETPAPAEHVLEEELAPLETLFRDGLARLEEKLQELQTPEE